MSTTHILPPGSMALALQPLADKLAAQIEISALHSEGKVAQATVVARNAGIDMQSLLDARTVLVTNTPKPNDQHMVTNLLDFDERLSGMPRARRSAAWNMVNGLNNFIIANLQSHIRTERRKEEADEKNKSLEIAGIDNTPIAERMALLTEKIRALQDEADQNHFVGNVTPMSAYDIADRLVRIRQHLANSMCNNAGFNPLRDRPQELIESIMFRTRERPKVKEADAMRWHLASGLRPDDRIPLAEIKATMLEQQIASYEALIEAAPQIVDLASSTETKEPCNDVEAELLFSELPAHVRHKLIGSVCKSLAAAIKSSTRDFLRGAGLDTLNNRVLINAVLEDYRVYLERFERSYSAELTEYIEQGFALKSFDEWVAPRS